MYKIVQQILVWHWKAAAKSLPLENLQALTAGETVKRPAFVQATCWSKKKIPWNSYPDLYGIHWLTTMWGRQTKWYDPLVHQHSDKHLNVPKGRSRNWQSIQQHVKLPAGTIKGWTKWRWSLNIPGFSCTKAWKAKELEIFHGGQDRIYLSSPSMAVSGTLEVPVL